MRIVGPALAAVCAAVVLALPASAAPSDEPCPAGLRCLSVEVPIDRSGRVPGTIALHVEVLPAKGREKGALMLLTGGPGQVATQSFRLGRARTAAYYRGLAPGYTLVAFDIRGVGRSEPLTCTPKHFGGTTSGFVTACANAMGPRRDFYGTAEHAEDVDSVRRELGYDRIALYGVSYGTKLALAYSLAHGSHVERLLLDSVVSPRDPDPYFTNVLSQLPTLLRTYCADGVCRDATPDFAGDVAALSRRLVEHPLEGTVRRRGGATTEVRLDQSEFFALLLDIGWNAGMSAELPAAVHAARL